MVFVCVNAKKQHQEDEGRTNKRPPVHHTNRFTMNSTWIWTCWSSRSRLFAEVNLFRQSLQSSRILDSCVTRLMMSSGTGAGVTKTWLKMTENEILSSAESFQWSLDSSPCLRNARSMWCCCYVTLICSRLGANSNIQFFWKKVTYFANQASGVDCVARQTETALQTCVIPLWASIIVDRAAPFWRHWDNGCCIRASVQWACSNGPVCEVCQLRYWLEWRWNHCDRLDGYARCTSFFLRFARSCETIFNDLARFTFSLLLRTHL